MFDPDIVDVSYIDDDGCYYGGFKFVPSIAKHFANKGRLTRTAEAAHCSGKGPQPYGTIFDVLTYDGNNHLCHLLFAHFVGRESIDTWERGSKTCTCFEGLDVDQWKTIVDQEK